MPRRSLAPIGWRRSALCSFVAVATLAGSLVTPASALELPSNTSITPTPKSGFVEGVSTEAVDLRTEFSRTYRNLDGTNTTKISTRPINYQLNGAWTPIDTKVVADTIPGTFRTTANRWTAHFGPAATGVRIADGNEQLALVPVEAAASMPTVDSTGTKVTYPEVWPGVDLVYHVYSNELKEEIVLKRRPDRNVFTFATGGVTLEADPEVAGALRPVGPLADRWRVPPAEVLDKNRFPVTGVASFEPSGSGELAQVAVNVDQAYLDGLSDDAFPIVVDPTYRTGSPESHSFRGNGEACWWCPLRVGNPDGNWWTWRGMAYFPYNNLFGKYITYAQLDVWNLFAGSSYPEPMSVYHATAFDWPSLGRQLINSSYGGDGSYGYNLSSEDLRDFYNDLVYAKEGGAFLKYIGQEGHPSWYTFKEFHAFELRLDWVDRAPTRSGDPWRSGDPYEDQSVTIYQNWNHPTDNARLFVCKNPGIATWGCTAGSWGSGGWTAPGNTAAASFVPGHAIGWQNYWTYVCTGAACSDAGYGQFYVYNRPPNLAGTVTDSPDPVNEGARITWEIPFTDYATGRAKGIVCKTANPNNGSCEPGQAWTTNGGFGGSPARPSWDVPGGYPPGTYTYYAFACDENNGCSGAHQGSFTVNRVPQIGQATHSPEPVPAGTQIRFDVPWTDGNGDSNRAIVCKTAATPTGNPLSCPGQQWGSTGAASGTSPSSAYYTPTDAEVRTQPYDYSAFACDTNNACSLASSGQFSVINATPTISSASDSPDPITAGGRVTFTVNWSDGGGDTDRAVICKTNNANGGACAAGQVWAIGDLTGGGTSTAGYDTLQANVGTNNYYAFACDDGSGGPVLCSASRSGTFTVTNGTPTITAVTDNPDPVASGSDVTFSATWTDAPGDSVRLVVCKTNTISAGNCAPGESRASGAPTSSGQATATYSTSQPDLGARTYYAFVCDSANSCSTSSQSGTFTVTNVAPTLASVSDTPDPVNVGSSIQFRLDWSDTGGDQTYAVVCKTNALDPDTSCVGDTNTWAAGWLGSDNPALASYTAAAADIGTRTYYAFICDSAGACSAARSGTFRVNGVPSSSSVTDAPDPVTSGGTVTFSLAYNDDAGDQVRAVVCKTNSLAPNGTCSDATWATGPIGTTNPATATYPTVQADVGTNNYWAFACDDDNACSAARSGSFTVTNATPSIGTVSDSPDPVTVTGGVTFSVGWSDGGGDTVRAVVCKTNNADGGSCAPGQAWAIGSLTATTPATAVYTTVQADVGTRTYYAFACDGAGACSSAVQGTFTVNNGIPIITAVSDSPDPVASGSPITFTVGWTDTPGDTVRAVVCKTNSVSSTATCPGGEWAIGSPSAASPSVATYATQQSDVGAARTYYAFACDAGNACTSSLSGAFVVTNVAPAPIGVSDSPDPVSAGSPLTFTLTWNDTGGDTNRAVICKTNAMSGGTCANGTWATGSLSAAGTSTATYSPVQADVGTARSYYAFACDSASACSATSVAGAFTVVNATPVIASATDSPDPVTAGSPLTFTVGWTDGGGDIDRAVICKTNNANSGACEAGQAWAIGVLAAGGTSTASYTPVQAELGARTYYAFACDGSGACSSSRTGTFTVINATPVISSASDSPDPVTAGSPITFTVGWADGGGDSDRAVICKTNAVSNGACSGGTWASGELTSGGTSTAAYTPVHAEVGSHTYFAFACDGANACSSSLSGTFTVANATPTATTVTDSPDPVQSGQRITFTLGWTDPGGDSDRAVICKTNAVSNGTCAGGAWASGSISSTSPSTAWYIATEADTGVNDYWAFACDGAGACSNGLAGQFSVEAVPPPVTAATVAQSDTAGLEDFYPYRPFDVGSDQAVVNMATGNLVVGHTDISAPGEGLSLNLVRTYNLTRKNQDGPLGIGTTLAIADTPASGIGRGPSIYAAANVLAFDDADGTRHVFVKDGSAGPGWHSPPGVNLTVGDYVANGAIAYRVTRPDGVRYDIEKIGAVHHVARVVDRNNNRLDFAYTLGRLTSVTDTLGRSLTFVWANNYVRTVRFASGAQTVEVTYTITDGQLTSVTEAAGTSHARTTNYEHSTRRLSAVVDGRGNRTSFNTTGENYVYMVVDRAGKIWHLQPGAAVPLPTTNGLTNYTITDPEGRVWDWVTTTFEHNLVLRRDPGDADAAGNNRQNSEVFTYQANRLQRRADQAGYFDDYTWDDLGMLTEHRRGGPNDTPLITTLAYTRPEPGVADLTDLRSAAGSAEERRHQFGYDGAGNLIRQVDPMGLETTFGYHDRGRLATVRDAEGRITSFGDPAAGDRGYHPSGQPTRVVDAAGKVRTLAYDFLGREIQTVDRENQTWTKSWDLRGNLLEAVSPVGDRTTYCYDANDNQTLVIRPRSPSRTCSLDGTDGYTTKHTYEPRDLTSEVRTASDGQQRKTRYTYANDGELLEILEPRSFDPATGAQLPTLQRASYQRYPNNRLAVFIDEEGHATDARWTPDGLIEHVTYPASTLGRRTVNYTYNKFRDVTAKLESAHSRPAISVYNLHRELFAEMTPKGMLTVHNRDSNGRETQTINAQLRITNRAYDRVGNLLSITQPTGIGASTTVAYTYTPRNEIATETDPGDAAHAIAYSYDGEGRQRFKDDKYLGIIERSVEQRYRADGRLIERDARRAATNNGRHRTTFAWDADGNQTALAAYIDGSTTEATSTSLDYTTAGEIRSWAETIEGVAKSGSYTWAQDGLLASRTVDGQTTTYGHDRRGLQTRVTPWGGSSNYSWAYHPSGLPRTANLPNTTVTDWSYDLADRVTSMRTGAGNRVLAGWDNINWDDDDLRTAETVTHEQADGTVLTGVGSYTYDSLNRLETYKSPFEPAATRYVLDDAGNVITELDHVNTYANNRIVSRQAIVPTVTPGQLPFNETTTYGYDHYGNRTTTTQDGNVGTITYDAADHTVNDNGVGGSYSVNYLYDGMNRLARRFDNTSTRTLFFHDAVTGELALETDGSGAVRTRYVLAADGTPLGNEDTAKPGIAGRGYYVLDPRGNLTTLVDGAPDVKATFAYDAFGGAEPSGTSASPGWDSRLRFQLAARDPSSGRYNVGARVLDPSTYRFIGADSYVGSIGCAALQQDPLTSNRYLYAGANSVNLIDDGHGPQAAGGPPSSAKSKLCQEILKKIRNLRNSLSRQKRNFFLNRNRWTLDHPDAIRHQADFLRTQAGGPDKSGNRTGGLREQITKWDRNDCDNSGVGGLPADARAFATMKVPAPNQNPRPLPAPGKSYLSRVGDFFHSIVTAECGTGDLACTP